jgi:hypothetical protein
MSADKPTEEIKLKVSTLYGYTMPCGSESESKSKFEYEALFLSPVLLSLVRSDVEGGMVARNTSSKQTASPPLSLAPVLVLVLVLVLACVCLFAASGKEEEEEEEGRKGKLCAIRRSHGEL